jgi:hypothetical protein
VRVLQTLAALLGFTAAGLTWVIGFRVTAHESFLSTTVALLIGLGAVGLLHEVRWRWSWILELVGLFLGFYFNPISPYFPMPSVFLAGSLLLTLAVALTAPRRRRDPDEAGEGAERAKE